MINREMTPEEWEQESLMEKEALEEYDTLVAEFLTYETYMQQYKKEDFTKDTPPRIERIYLDKQGRYSKAVFKLPIDPNWEWDEKDVKLTSIYPTTKNMSI